MRIIAGTARGRTLKGPKGPGLRPTADRVRESLFNILGQYFEGIAVLDLFAGTGALAFEALSRGAARAVLVDKGRESLKLCRENAEMLGMQDRAEIVSGAVEPGTLASLRRRGQFQLVFADPPYADFTPTKVLELLDAADLLAAEGRVVVEHDKRAEAPEEVGRLHLVETRRFGDTAVSFYQSAHGNLTQSANQDQSPRMSSHVVVYPGSFDPPTNGHVSLINRALRMFDKVIVAVAHNPKKTPLFTVEERKQLLRDAVSNDPHVEIDAFEGLLVDYCRQRNVKVMMRGLRAVSDFEYEFQMANMNRKLDKDLETVFVMTGEDYFYISSQLVREVASFGGNVEDLVPPNVLAKLRERFKK